MVQKKQEVHLALPPDSLEASHQRELWLKKGRWSRWRVRRQAEGGCGEAEKA